MYSFLNAVFDTLFPLSPHAKCVQDATCVTLTEACSPHIFGDTTVLASYHTPLVHAFIHEAKFHRNGRAVALLGQVLGIHLRKSLHSNIHSEIHLIPIPLSTERLRERGHNQVLEIALAAHIHTPHMLVNETVLQKIQHTPSQTSLTRAERLKNLNGVFAIGKHTLPHNAHIVLFDDIVTTGATFREASRALREAGFTHVTQLALAH